MSACALAANRRIVVKIGSALLVDRASGPARATGWPRSPTTSPRSAPGGSGSARRLVRRHRARPQRCSKLPGRAEARGEPGRRRGRADRAGARLGGGARPSTASPPGQILLTLGDTEERRRYLNARATIAHAAQARRRAGRQRERHGGDERDPLRRQRPAGGARRLDDERRLPGAALRHRRALHRAAARRSGRPIHPEHVARDHAGDRGDGRRLPARNCRAAAW